VKFLGPPLAWEMYPASFDVTARWLLFFDGKIAGEVNDPPTYSSLI
jgi:hypothetical protein